MRMYKILRVSKQVPVTTYHALSSDSLSALVDDDDGHTHTHTPILTTTHQPLIMS